MDRQRYKVLKAVKVLDTTYKPGIFLDLTDEQAAPLLKSKQIMPAPFTN